MHNLITRQLNFGFSLIEILVSLLILSLGICGALRMQLLSMQTSMQSNLYSTAMELISDMAERMRSNHGSWPSTSLNPFTQVQFQSDDDNQSASGSCYVARCAPDQLAATDIAQWLQQVEATLPNARAVICRDSSPWNSATGELNWDCAVDDNASIVIKLGWADQHDADVNPPPRLAVAVSP